MTTPLIEALRAYRQADEDGIMVIVSRQACDEAADEIERLRRVEEDHKNVLKAALHNEPNGIDLVHRLTTYAIRERRKV